MSPDLACFSVGHGGDDRDCMVLSTYGAIGCVIADGDKA